MALKRPNAISFSKKNAVRPFEDASSLEFWAQKNDASMFIVGQSTKKRPHGMTFVRMFDYRVLDMCEVGVDDWKSMADFKVRAHSLSTNPVHRTRFGCSCFKRRHRRRHPDTSRCCTLRRSCSTRTRASYSSSRCSWTSSMAR